MRMREFDRIIGYDAVKKELERMADALKNMEHYEKLGVSPPKGLLLCGAPGVGKTTMASALVEACGRPVFLCRRDRPDGDFVWTIHHTFQEAAEAEPSVVFLDDLDKFSKSEEGCSNEEEFVAVQAGIDSLKGKNVFVLATANDIDGLPDSLLRPGRFDKTVIIKKPTLQESKQVTAHYLSGKKLAADVDTDTIAGIMSGHSCAALETAVNTAGILAGYERAGSISMKHLVLGCLETLHQIPPDLILEGRKDAPDDFSSDVTRAAWHEAGHAVVSEVLRPGSVTLVCIHEARNDSRGFTACLPRNRNSFAALKNSVVCALAGNAALEQRFGTADPGGASDLEDAIGLLRDAFGDAAYGGFTVMYMMHNRSERHAAETENAIAQHLRQCDSEARQILAANMRFLETTVIELLDKGLLTARDIQRIKKDCISQ